MPQKKPECSKRTADTKALKRSQIEALCRTWAEVARAILLRRKNPSETQSDQH